MTCVCETGATLWGVLVGSEVQLHHDVEIAPESAPINDSYLVIFNSIEFIF